MSITLALISAGFIAIAWAWSRGPVAPRKSSNKQPQHTTGESDTTVPESVQAGRKIEAIKLHREQTGLGLKEAKDAVESMSSGELQPTALASQANQHQQLTTLEDLIQSGYKIEAIKLYREQSGVGLKEAKAAIEAKIASANQGPLAPTPLDDADSPTVENLLKAGRKIEAIVLYRNQSGVGLKAARDHVEALAQQLFPR